jgi:hypothetical protein
LGIKTCKIKELRVIQRLASALENAL